MNTAYQAPFSDRLAAGMTSASCDFPAKPQYVFDQESNPLPKVGRDSRIPSDVQDMAVD